MPESNKMEAGPEAVTGIQPNQSKELFPHHERETSGRVEDPGAKSQKRSQGSADLTEDPHRLRVQIEGTAQKPELKCINQASKAGVPRG